MTNHTIEKSKLFALLDCLTKKEATKLGKWLRSPVHNNSKDVVQLYEGIKTAMRRNGTKPTNQSTLLKYIGELPDSKQDISLRQINKLNQVMYKLRVQIKDYLLWEKVKEDDILPSQQLMETLLVRGKHEQIISLITQTKKKLESLPYRDITYCERAFKLAEMEFYVNIIVDSRNVKITKASMEGVSNKLREYSLSNLLRYYCATANSEKFHEIKLDYPLRNAIRQHLKSHADKEQPSVGVYYRLLELLLNGSLEDYDELKVFLFENLEVFDVGETRQFFNHMTNFCTRMLANEAYKGKVLFSKRHEIYEKGLELKCWTSNMSLSYQFVNIVRNALLLGDKDEWVKIFIETYQHHLKANVKKNILDYCDALVTYHNKQFDVAISHLPTQESPQNFAYFLDIKVLKIKIHYDSDDWGFLPDGGYAISNELENIRHYINRPSKKISSNIRERYTNFVNISKQIFARKRKLTYPDPDDLPVTHANLQSLQIKLNNTKPLTERTWLEEKLEELINDVK